MAGAVRWDASEYGANTGHHRAFDDHVLGPLRFEPGWHVLDVGCGVGDLTARIAGLVPQGWALGVDAAPPLVAAAAANHGEISNLAFAEWRAERLGELGDRSLRDGRRIGPPFDLVVSTAALHWVPAHDHPAVYTGIREVLRPGGVLRAEFGGTGQIASVREVLDEESGRLGGAVSPWCFPDPNTVRAQVLMAGLSLADGFVRLVRQRRSIPDAGAFVGWLTSQVLIAYAPGLDAAAAERFRERSIARLLVEARRADGSYDQEYVRVDVLARRAG
ncbi:MAG TPA: methyltransferase [Acidimicrobiales bacterium]|nr:methyltransferase [Acidimicrobiales bacterium]